MDFTREPIIETIITPKEGCKLVVRSSKATGQEEYFVDSIEVVVFGNAIFFRSLERPKAFVVPASDYEILEVREAKVVLKNVGIERSIKIGSKQPREVVQERPEPVASTLAPAQAQETEATQQAKQEADSKLDRKRDRRRHTRRRRGAGGDGEGEASESGAKDQEPSSQAVANIAEAQADGSAAVATPAPKPKPILPPPETLISDTIARYRDNALFQGAFYVKKDETLEGEQASTQDSTEDSMIHFRPQDDLMDPLDLQNVILESPEFGSFGVFEEEEVSTDLLPKNEKNAGQGTSPSQNSNNE